MLLLDWLVYLVKMGNITYIKDYYKGKQDLEKSYSANPEIEKTELALDGAKLRLDTLNNYLKPGYEEIMSLFIDFRKEEGYANKKVLDEIARSMNSLLENHEKERISLRREIRKLESLHSQYDLGGKK